MKKLIVVAIIGLSCIIILILLTRLPKLPSEKSLPSVKQISITPVGISIVPGEDACSTSKATGGTVSTHYPVHGLVSDGKGDNTTVIQQAINEAANGGGGIVQLPKGTFLINGHIMMKDNVTLKGSGVSTVLKAGSKFLNSPESVGYSVISTDGSSNVTIEDLTADAQGNKLDANTINRFLGYVIYVHNSKNVIVKGVYTRNPFSYSIVAESSEHFCFMHNNTQVDTSGKYDQLDGIHVLNSSFGDVLRNYIDQGYGNDGDDGLAAHTIGGIVHDVTFAGNIVRGGKGGAGMQLALTDPTDMIYNIKIQNNEFWGSPRGIRTGYYGGVGISGGSVHDILIGGSVKTGNYIHDNIFHNTNVGDTINIYGNGIDPYNITVIGNTYCKSGTISVGTGTNNVVKDNEECKN